MLKKSKVFLGIFIIVLLTLVSGSVFVTSSINNSVNKKVESEMFNWYSDELDYLTILLAQEFDENYEIFTFDESIPLETREKITKDVENRINSIVQDMKKDLSFSYKAINKETGEEINHSYNHENVKIMDEQHYIFDSNGNLNDTESSYSFFHSKGVHRIISEDNYKEDIENYSAGKIVNNIQLNTPKNLEITYELSNADPGENEFFEVNSYIYTNRYNVYISLILIVGSALLFLFFLIYPVSVVQETQPFKTIKKWKFGINVAWLSLAIISSMMLCMFVIPEVFEGHIIQNLEELLNIQFSSELSILIISIIYFITYFFVSLALFLVKYIITSGFVRYCKEDTLIGSFFLWSKRKIDEITDVDLADSLQKELVKLCLINAAVMIVLIIIFPIGWLLAIIYSIIVYVFLKNKLSKIQSDYTSLLESTRELSNGNFDIMEKDMGVFNSLKIEFTHVKDGFEKAVEEEVKSSNMKTELISNVSHDLKTPLTCIKNYIVLLQDDSLDEKTRKEYMESLSQYSNRLQTLIEDLFDISKINSGNIQLNLMPLNIVSMIEQIRVEYEEVLNSKHLEVLSTYEDKEIVLNLDMDKTYRIFENLFTNIGKYAMPNSRVYIDVSSDDSYVKVEFKNISENAMNFTADEIVERFVRGDKSRHETGSGIGLAIAKSFTEVQKGEFKIHIDGDLFKVVILLPKE